MQKTVLSTADVARLFNVTETTVKRWADGGALQCQKTPGGHRKFVIRYVIEFAEKNKLEPAGVLEMPEERGTPDIEVAVLQKDYAALARTFMEKALSTSRQDLPFLFSFLYEHKFQLWEIYDEIVRAGMAEIGAQWEEGRVSVGWEHLASYQVLDAFAKLQMQMRIKPENGLSALCASPGNEWHDIGLRCVSHLLRSEGWRVHYLGAVTPFEDIQAWIRGAQPTLVCLSLTNGDGLSSVAEQLEQTAAVAREHGTHLVLGGRAASLPDLKAGQAGALLSSVRELLEYIAGVESARLERKE